MKILILDSDELLWQGIKYYKDLEKDWKFLKPSQMKKKGLDYKDIDLVIVDVSEKEYQKMYEDILLKDKTKRIIVISESLKSCNTKDCSFCEQNNEIRRLMKPIDLKKLYSLMKSFDKRCDFFGAFENIGNLIESILKRYSSLIFDDQSQEVYINIKAPTNLYTQELLSFVNILEQNSVPYKVVDETKIKIK